MLTAGDFIGAVGWLRASTVGRIELEQPWRAAIDDEALENIRAASSLDEATYNLATALWSQDELVLTALAAFESAAQAGSSDARAALGESLHWMGESVRAIPWLELAVQDKQTDRPWLRGLLGEAHLAASNYETAIAFLTDGLEEYPEFGVPLAKALNACGRAEEATELLGAPEVASQFGAAIMLGNLLGEADDLVGAEAAYRRGIASGDAHSAYNLGLLYNKRRQYIEARRAFKLAREMGDLWEPPTIPEINRSP